jgi:hypothetical protein
LGCLSSLSVPISLLICKRKESNSRAVSNRFTTRRREKMDRERDSHLVVDVLGEDLVPVEDLDGEVAACGAVARVLDLAKVALPEGPPDLIPPQQRRTRPLRLRLVVHHSQTRPPLWEPNRPLTPYFLIGNSLYLSLSGSAGFGGRRRRRQGGGDRKGGQRRVLILAPLRLLFSLPPPPVVVYSSVLLDGVVSCVLVASSVCLIP